MIVESLMGLVYYILTMLMQFEIPNLPSEVYEYIETLFDYMSTGAGLLANYVPLPLLVSLFALLLTVDGSIILYHFVMWIIRKIPMAGMS